jgi:quinol monooxygenase YgiN
MTTASGIIQVTEYELADTAETYIDAISALADRTDREGHPGVLGYQFYVNRTENTAGAVIQYADSDAWLAHHRMAYQWVEMPALQATVALKRLTLFGPLNDELRAWIGGTGLEYIHYDEAAAGFIRQP